MATFYFDKTMGNDSTGTGTELNPYQNYFTFEASMDAGNTFYLKCGETWRHTSNETINGEGGSAGNPFTLTKYGAGNNPIITSNGAITSGWSSYASNVWRQTASAKDRVFFAKAAQNKASSVAGVNSTNKWYHDGTYLYVYHVGNPSSTLIESVPTSGKVSALRCINTPYFEVDAVDVQGGNQSIDYFRNDANTTDGIEIRNCAVGMSASIGIRLSAIGTGLILEYNTLDNDMVTEPLNVDNGNGDAIRPGCNSACVIQYNNITDYTHSGIQQDRVSAIVSGHDIKYNAFYTLTSTHMRMWHLDGNENADGRLGLRDFNARWNYHYGYITHCHSGGDAGKYYGNILEAGPSGTENNGFNLSAVDNGECWGCELFNNLAYGILQAGLRQVNTGTAGREAKNCTLRNNITFNCGYGLEVWPSTTDIHNNTYTNNILYSSSTSLVVSYRSNVYSIVDFEGNLTGGDVANSNIHYQFLFSNQGAEEDQWHASALNTQGLTDEYNTSAYNDRDGNAFNARGAFALVTTGVTEPITSKTLRLTGSIPAISIIGDYFADIPVKSMVLVSYAPVAYNTSVVSVSIPQGTLRLIPGTGNIIFEPESPYNYPLVPNNLPDLHNWLIQVANVLNGAMHGKTNNTGYCKLNANATTTAVSYTSGVLGQKTVIQFMPLTANAAAEMNTMYVSSRDILNKTFTITHANTATTDRRFSYVFIG